MNIKTTEAWVQVNSTEVPEVHFKVVSTNPRIENFIPAEKKTGYFHSKEELAKIIADALDYGKEHQDNPALLCDWRTEYIVNLFK